MSLENVKTKMISQKKKVKLKEDASTLKTDFEKELEQGLIRKQTFKGVVTYFNSKGTRVNANGEPVTKSGEPDKRKNNGMKNWEQVAARNKTNNVVKTAIVESDSDSEPEFEIEIEEPLKAQQAQPPVQPAPPVVDNNKYEQLIKEQEEIRKKYDDQLRQAKEENNKLKSGLVFNDHLARISHMARNTKIRF